MSIRASSHKQIDTLVRDLASSRDVTRDAAVARLTVIGPRAVERLTAVAASVADGPSARAAALRALEAIGDPRALDAGLKAALDTDATVATAGIGVARAFLKTQRSAEVVDRLTGLALDRARAQATRIAAIRALGELRTSTVAPVLAALGTDPDARIAVLATASRVKDPDPVVWLAAAAQGPLPDDPSHIRRALAQSADALSLPSLHRLVQRVREREDAEPPSRRAEWTTTRAAVHQALAARGSRIALYDLREALEGAAAPLPVEFLTALTDIGDTTCLEAIAAAYAKARAKRGNDWWRDRLADAFRAIVAREKITMRHATMKKIGKRWPRALPGLGLKAYKP